MAARLRRDKPMTLKWLAERLAMGNRTNVSNLLAAGNKPGRGKHGKTVKSENRPLSDHFSGVRSMARCLYEGDDPKAALCPRIELGPRVKLPVEAF